MKRRIEMIEEEFDIKGLDFSVIYGYVNERPLVIISNWGVSTEYSSFGHSERYNLEKTRKALLRSSYKSYLPGGEKEQNVIAEELTKKVMDGLSELKGESNMNNYKIGILAYNGENERFGMLICDLWEVECFHCGDCFEVWDSEEEKWNPVRIEKHFQEPSLIKEDYENWYLVGTKLQGEELEGLRIRIEV